MRTQKLENGGRMWIGKFELEWSFRSRLMLVHFEQDTDGWTASLYLWLFGLALTYKANWYWKARRDIKISIFDGYIHWVLWRDDMEWHRGDWRNASFSFVDFFVGRSQHSEEDLDTYQVVIPMAEGNYPATVRLYISRWKRPRWPGTRVIRKGEITIEQGIPVPGKGENDWDMDDDAIYSIDAPASTVQEMIQKAVDHANRYRQKYGWQG